MLGNTSINHKSKRSKLVKSKPRKKDEFQAMDQEKSGKAEKNNDDKVFTNEVF